MVDFSKSELYYINSIHKDNYNGSLSAMKGINTDSCWASPQQPCSFDFTNPNNSIFNSSLFNLGNVGLNNVEKMLAQDFTNMRITQGQSSAPGPTVQKDSGDSASPALNYLSSLIIGRRSNQVTEKELPTAKEADKLPSTGAFRRYTKPDSSNKLNQIQNNLKEAISTSNEMQDRLN